MGNSGTGSRLLMGLIAGSDVEATILGDESLSKRPMKRIIKPLMKTGAVFDNPSNIIYQSNLEVLKSHYLLNTSVQLLLLKLNLVFY